MAEILILGAGAFILYNYLDFGKRAKQFVSHAERVITPEIIALSHIDTLDTEVTEYKPMASKILNNIQNLSETGMIYAMEKVHNLDMTNLNEAYKPWSAPIQHADTIPQVLANQAVTAAYLEANGSPFYFNKTGEIFLGGAAHDNLNVEIPSRASIQHDPNSSLASLPRVYIDGGFEQNLPTAEYRDGLLNAGQPDSYEMDRVQREKGPVYEPNNPWGPGGAFPRLFNPRQEQVSRIRGVDRSTRMAPPFGH